MSKLPTKQIYLLLIIIVGIIALSVYSTYAIFTLESHTSDIVSIHTPNSLQISEDMYEYKQISVDKDSSITTDVDIYNAYDYELCYSIWYKVAAEFKDSVKVYQNNTDSLTTSGTITTLNSTRIQLMIINDSEEIAKVNIGVAFSKKEDTCSLNISKDKSIVTSTINNPEELSTVINNNVNKTNNDAAGYLTYKNIEDIITLSNETKTYISETFTYQNETFTLTNPQEIDSKDIVNYISNENKNYYTCLNNQNCQFLYKINAYTKETVKDETTNEDIDIYKITSYDRLVGYLQGTSGIKKVTTNNTDAYLYYGDNPHNFIYYNCTNEQDPKTCELWRIIGTYYDQTENKYLTKIIKNDPIDSLQYNNNNDNLWENSSLNKYLNEEYRLNDAYLKQITYKQNYLTNLDLTIDTINTFDYTHNTKITIMSLTDYLNASTCTNIKINEYNEDCLNSNWLNINSKLNEWTLTANYTQPPPPEEAEVTNETTDETTITDNLVETIINNTIYSVGTTIKETTVTEKMNVRPVVYLKSRIFLQEGDGTLDNPYMIK